MGPMARVRKVTGFPGPLARPPCRLRSAHARNAPARPGPQGSSEGPLRAERPLDPGHLAPGPGPFAEDDRLSIQAPMASMIVPPAEPTRPTGGMRCQMHGAPHPPRWRATPTVIAVGLLLAACGSSENPASPAAGASATTPESARASAPATAAPPACMDARFLYLPRLEHVVLAGCVDQGNAAAREQLWSWDGASWQLLADDGPPAAVVTGFAYDGDRERLVRYGGLPLDGDECVAETWEWGADGWREAEAVPPPACDHLKLAYDAARRITLLVGGGDGNQQLVPGTWSWDGEAWRELADAGPPPRAHFGFVHDDAHQQTLLYGGYDGRAVFDDLWSWDGEGWAQIRLTGPGPRSHLGMAVSPGGLLLFGGASTTSTFGSLTDETWYLTDGAWRQLEGPGPSPRGLPALGYDPARDVMVLYGGFGPGGEALSDLWEWDGAWTCVANCP